MMPPIELAHFFELSKVAILKASSLLLKNFAETREQLNVTVKQDQTIQTKSDLESEQIILSALSPFLGDCSFYSEETEGNYKQGSRYVILIDPLDGTSNYYRARSGFGMTIALVHFFEGFPNVIMVLTYEPNTKRLWSAARGEGCFLEFVGSGPPHKVHVSNIPPNEGDICFDASTISHRVIENSTHKSGIIQKIIPIYKNFRMLGSNVIAHALVANGSFEAAVTDTVGGPFDIAGFLLVEEAGGKASNLIGQPINVFEDSVIVTSNGIGHEKLVKMLCPFYG